MTDEGLIRLLRSFETVMTYEAADRIEQLLESIKGLSQTWATAAVNREVSEGKLAEAVKALRDMLEDSEYWSPYARATLAELEKAE